MFHAGVIRWVSGADIGRPHSCGRLFILPSGRVILNPAAFNADEASAPPPFSLPSPRLVCEALKGATYIFKCDFKSYYYQIPLPEPAAAAFRFWLMDGTTPRAAECTRLPMGWRPSAAVADAVSRHIAGVSADEIWSDPVRAARGFLCYIDDTATPSPDAAEEFRRRAAGAGVEIKTEEEFSGGAVCRYLGMDFHTALLAFRVSPSLADKLRVAGRELSRPLAERERMRVAGMLVAFLERCGSCLAVGFDVWNVLLPRGHHRGSPREGGVPAGEALQRIIANGTGWRRVVTPRRVIYGASDASTSGWGWVWLEDTPRWGGGRWSRTPNIHINYLEAIAVLRAIRHAPRDAELRLHIDNLVVATWVTRGTSRMKFACRLICRLERLAVEKGCRILAQYVPSAQNIADGLSRGDAAPSSLSLPPWQVGFPRRVLGWCRPVEEDPPEERTARAGARGESDAGQVSEEDAERFIDDHDEVFDEEGDDAEARSPGGWFGQWR